MGLRQGDTGARKFVTEPEPSLSPSPWLAARLGPGLGPVTGFSKKGARPWADCVPAPAEAVPRCV